MSSSEKTEKPTQQRLKKEGRKGKSYNSRDLSAAAMLLGGLPAIVLLGSMQRVGALYVDIASHSARLSPHVAAMAALKGLLVALAPVLLICVVLIVLLSLWMSKGIVAAEAVRLDFTRLNPVSGFKNLFSLRVVKDLVRTLLYLLFASLFCWLAIGIWGPDLFALVRATPGQLAMAWAKLSLSFSLGLLAALAPVYLLTGWVDHLLYIREMKMEKHEVKREHKDNETKPEVRQRRRDIADELSAQVQADTLGSKVVLANPTHIAVGLFVMDDGPVMPFVSVREKGRRARKVIALAEANGIPVVRDIRLARAVYFNSQRYRFVQSEQLDAVMNLVTWLRDVERAGAPHASDGSDKPGAPPN